jgi:hypothetical protein
MRSEPAAAGSVMPTRTPAVVPAPRLPVVYRTDPETLRRVAEALRALEPWHEPRAAEAVTSGAPATP